VTAAVDSILDLRRTVIGLALDFGELPLGARFGGLRGGTVRITKAGAELQRFSYVPGVRLSGVIPTALLLKNSGAPATLGVSGPAASTGRLRVAARGRLTGVLGGRPVRANVSAKVKVARATAGREAPWSGGPMAFPIPALARVR
jgi:hypothetical protein